MYVCGCCHKMSTDAELSQFCVMKTKDKEDDDDDDRKAALVSPII